MKKMIIAVVSALAFSCNTASEKTIPPDETKNITTKADMNMAGYTATYSTSFEMGDSKNAEAILALYKDWDNGNLDPSKSLFADSIHFYTNDGNIIHGHRDSAIASMQHYRDMFSSIKSTVHAIFPIKSVDKNENWVCIWATEVNTTKEGKTDSTRLQETWRFNKKGKIDLLYQYNANATPPDHPNR